MSSASRSRPPLHKIRLDVQTDSSASKTEENVPRKSFQVATIVPRSQASQMPSPRLTCIPPFRPSLSTVKSKKETVTLSSLLVKDVQDYLNREALIISDDNVGNWGPSSSSQKLESNRLRYHLSDNPSSIGSSSIGSHVKTEYKDTYTGKTGSQIIDSSKKETKPVQSSSSNHGSLVYDILRRTERKNKMRDDTLQHQKNVNFLVEDLLNRSADTSRSLSDDRCNNKRNYGSIQEVNDSKLQPYLNIQQSPLKLCKNVHSKIDVAPWNIMTEKMEIGKQYQQCNNSHLFKLIGNKKNKESKSNNRSRPPKHLNQNYYNYRNTAGIFAKSRTPSPRPPTTKGSHRPALSSIINDDWTIDSHVVDKKERREKRRIKNATGNPSPFVKQNPHHRVSSSSSYSSYNNGDNKDSHKNIKRWIEQRQYPNFETTSRSNDGDIDESVSTKSSYDSSSTTTGSSTFGEYDLENRHTNEWKRKALKNKHQVYKKEKEIKSKEEKNLFDPPLPQIIISSEVSPLAEIIIPGRNSLEEKSSRSSQEIYNSIRAYSKEIETRLWQIICMLEVYISNLPSLVGALALAWASMGVDWFKYTEETISACTPVDYHSPRCTFPEFPGCFECESDNLFYRMGLYLHLTCSAVSACLILLYVIKLIIAFPVIRSEMTNPTTAAPAGLICMAILKVLAGRFGYYGEVIICFVCATHMALAMWFIYISIVYKALPEPSWYPNTTGIGLAAVKMFLYFPNPAILLMSVSLVCTFLFFPVSIVRTAVNRKIGAPVCWVQMSAPAVCLYGLSIMAQPATDIGEEKLLSNTANMEFYRIHRKIYMPVMHCFFLLCMIGMLSAVHSLIVRWKDFRQKEFSPAHASLCAPLLSHVNALQAYRSVVDKFSYVPVGSPFKIWLYIYWLTLLFLGSILTVFVTIKFFIHLKFWVLPNVEDDEILPEPSETMTSQIIANGIAGDGMRQKFVSASVLQVNETGALIRVLRGTEDQRGAYVRTRRLPSLGFEPTLNLSELYAERNALLDRVARKPPRARKRTMSFSFLDVNSSNNNLSQIQSSREEMSEERPRPMSLDASNHFMHDDHL